jgi:hypothetical protein
MRVIAFFYFSATLALLKVLTRVKAHLCACYALAMRLLCYALAMRLLCACYALAMRLLCYALAMRLLCACYAMRLLYIALKKRIKCKLCAINAH